MGLPNDARLLDYPQRLEHLKLEDERRFEDANSPGPHEQCINEAFFTFYVDQSSLEFLQDSGRTVYVGGEHTEAIKTHLLKNLFSECGTVEYIKRVPRKGCAFVQ